jgi:hypothetical protein
MGRTSQSRARRYAVNLPCMCFPITLVLVGQTCSSSRCSIPNALPKGRLLGIEVFGVHIYSFSPEHYVLPHATFPDNRVSSNQKDFASFYFIDRIKQVQMSGTNYQIFGRRCDLTPDIWADWTQQDHLRYK